MKILPSSVKSLALFATISLFPFAEAPAYETAEYEVIREDGDFQIRQYAPMTVAEVKVAASANDKQDQAFQKLFRYISGNNDADQKIAMTTPVFMPGTADGKAQRMQFVLPKEVAAKNPPAPSSGDVRLLKRKGGTYISVRFSGRPGAKERAQKLDALQAWARQQGIKTEGDAIYAGYNAPWTPGVMRRNEVLLKVSKSSRIPLTKN